MFAKLKNFDIYPKTIEDFREKTVIGAASKTATTPINHKMKIKSKKKKKISFHHFNFHNFHLGYFGIFLLFENGAFR